MNLFVVFIIAVGLSMDAFSLSLAYGTLNINKKDILLQSIIVGVYHFIMPKIGNFFGIKILSIIPIKIDIIVFIVLIFIGIQMIVESLKEEEIKYLNIKEMLIFGFAVSIDSFSLGIGLKAIYNNITLCSIIFMTTSFLFTYIGLKVGKKINDVLGKISTIVGGIILMIIGLLYII